MVALEFKSRRNSYLDEKAFWESDHHYAPRLFQGHKIFALRTEKMSPEVLGVIAGFLPASLTREEVSYILDIFYVMVLRLAAHLPARNLGGT